MEYIHISWKKLVTDCIILAQKIRRQKIDEIITIARGGLVTGRLLSDYLSIPISVIGISSYQANSQIQSPKVLQGITIDLAGKSVLLIDDVSDTGSTFLIARLYVQSLSVRKLLTGSLYKKSHTKFIPDYWIEVIDDWIIFPYEIHEQQMEFQKKIGKSGMQKLKELGVEDWEIYE